MLLFYFNGKVGESQDGDFIRDAKLNILKQQSQNIYKTIISLYNFYQYFGQSVFMNMQFLALCLNPKGQIKIKIGLQDRKTFQYFKLIRKENTISKHKEIKDTFSINRFKILFLFFANLA